MLKDLPKDDNAEPIQQKVQEKEAELEAAQKELCANFSERFQKLAQREVAMIEQELTKLRTQWSLNPSPSLSTCTLAELDKRRAIAIASKESWQARATKKATEITDGVNQVLNDISDAQKALDMQKEHINELHQSYKDNWESRQESILSSHNAKITELQDACLSKGQVPVETDVLALQAQVKQLLEQLQALQAASLPSSSTQTRSNDTSLQEPACKKAKSDMVDEPNVAAPLVLELSKDSSATAESFVDLCDEMGPKGKGKGKDKSHAIYWCK